MSHVRQQIRDAAAAALTGLTTTGANVYAPRQWGQQRSKVPALEVEIRSEEVAAQTFGSSYEQQRKADLVVSAWAVSNTSAAGSDVVDLVDAEVSVALFADAALDLLLDDLRWQSLEKEDDGAGADLRVKATITFAAFYTVDQRDPTTTT